MQGLCPRPSGRIPGRTGLGTSPAHVNVCAAGASTPSPFKHGEVGVMRTQPLLLEEPQGSIHQPMMAAMQDKRQKGRAERTRLRPQDTVSRCRTGPRQISVESWKPLPKDPGPLHIYPKDGGVLHPDCIQSRNNKKSLNVATWIGK